jgi:putative photosynthetic complex assembly protein
MAADIYFEPEPGQRSADATIKVPKPLLYMCGVLAVVAYAIAIAASQFGWFKDPPMVAPVVEARAYTFVDALDGAILVYDRSGQRLLSRLEPASFGFLRGSLRALSRHRMLAGVGAEPPFHLVRYADGRIQLEDSTTRQQVVVTSFGPTQIAEFERLFNPPPAAADAAASRVPASAEPITRPANVSPGDRPITPASQPFNTPANPRAGAVQPPTGGR